MNCFRWYIIIKLFRMLWKTSHTCIEVAVKTFRYRTLTDSIKEEFRKECATLRQLNHPNILILFGYIYMYIYILLP